MALTGKLSDMSVGDVLQLPSMGARTGELKIAGEQGAASIYYKDGRIVHVICGEQRDEAALVAVLDFSRGDFVFEQGVDSPDLTIEDDLHLLLMRAAKQRDERKKSAGPGKEKTSLSAPEMNDILRQSLESNKGILVLGFVDRSGNAIAAQPENSSALTTAQAFAKSCFALADQPPRSAVKRCWVEDDEGHCLWLRLGEDVSLVILAQTSVSMGVLMLASTKIGSCLKNAKSGKK